MKCNDHTKNLTTQLVQLCTYTFHDIFKMHVLFSIYTQTQAGPGPRPDRLGLKCYLPLGGTRVVGGGEKGWGTAPPSPSPPPQSRTKLTHWPCPMLHNNILNILYIYSFIYRPHPPRTPSQANQAHPLALSDVI